MNFSKSLGFILFVVILFIVIAATMGEKAGTFVAGLVLLSMLVLNGEKLGTMFTELSNAASGNPIDTGSVKITVNPSQGVKLA